MIEFDDQAEGVSIQKSLLDFFDWNTFILTILLITFGLLSIYSATYDAGMPTYFVKQLVYAGLGMAVLVVLTFIPERWLYNTAYISYGIGILLLVAVLVIGKVVYGQKNWIVLGPISFQPSEIAKLATLIALARFIQQPNVNLRTLRDLGIAAGIVMLPVGLIMLEPDLGSATVFMAMLLGVALWAGADTLLLFAIVTPPIVALVSFFGKTPFYVAVGIVAISAFTFRRSLPITLLVISLSVGAGFSAQYGYDHVLKPHQQDRIKTFLDPNNDPKGKGYHVIQSKMAVGSGGLLGKGFLHGTQTQLRYIPKQWTDFIYCVPTEEFGFVGGFLVIAFLTGLCYRAISIAGVARGKFASVMSIGIATIFMYHTMVNIGMAIGLMPVMGIPLPFLSAGGSSLLVNMAMVGLLLNFYRQRKERATS